MFDSNEEYEFSLWLEELTKKGYINKWYKNTVSMHLIDKQSISFFEILKTKTNTKNIFLLHDLEYTYDFYIEWNSLAEGLFFIKEGSPYSSEVLKNKLFVVLKNTNNESFIDIKGTFGGGNSAITFPVIQKIVFLLKKMYIQKIIPKNLFENTFLPQKLSLKKDGTLRKIAEKTINLETYLKNGRQKKGN